MNRIVILALAGAVLISAAAQAQQPATGGPYTPQFLADYQATFQACKARYERPNPACTGSECLPTPSATSIFGELYDATCDSEATKTAQRMQTARELSGAWEGPSIRQPTAMPQTAPLPPQTQSGGKVPPGVAVPLANPLANQPEYGLTIEAPIKITNFHRTWGKIEIAKEGDFLGVHCRLYASSGAVTILATGIAYLPAPPEGGNLDTVVKVGIDVDPAILGEKERSYDCILTRPGLGPGEPYKPDNRACGAWTEEGDREPCFAYGSLIP